MEVGGQPEAPATSPARKYPQYSDAVGQGTALQLEKFGCSIPNGVRGISIDLILPVAQWSWGRFSL